MPTEACRDVTSTVTATATCILRVFMLSLYVSVYVYVMSSPSSSFHWDLLSSDPPASTPTDDPTRMPPSRTYFSMVAYAGKLWMFGGFGDARGRFNDIRTYDGGEATSMERVRWHHVTSHHITSHHHMT